MKIVKKIAYVLCLITSALTLCNVVVYFLPSETCSVISSQDIGEKFDKKYMNLNSVSKLTEYCDKRYEALKHETIIHDTTTYVRTLSEIVKQRFHHGLARYTLLDHWLLYLEGAIVWDHISAIVQPDDILKHCGALCSQQQLVFLEVLKKKKISFRYVGLGLPQGPGHFISEVYYGKKWNMVDVNGEPDWKATNYVRKDMSFLKKNPDVFYEMYKHKHDHKTLDVLLSKIEYGQINNLPGAHMKLFHTINTILLFLIPLAFYFVYRKIKA